MATKASRTTSEVNEVRLIGRVSGTPVMRTLPSGDEIAVCRLVVPRRPVRLRANGRRGPSVDVVDCAAWTQRPRTAVARWAAGDEVEVTGALRRRFFRAGGQTVSRVEVEIRKARLVRRGDG